MFFPERIREIGGQEVRELSECLIRFEAIDDVVVATPAHAHGRRLESRMDGAVIPAAGVPRQTAAEGAKAARKSSLRDPGQMLDGLQAQHLEGDQGLGIDLRQGGNWKWGQKGRLLTWLDKCHLLAGSCRQLGHQPVGANAGNGRQAGETSICLVISRARRTGSPKSRSQPERSQAASPGSSDFTRGV